MKHYIVIAVILVFSSKALGSNRLFKVNDCVKYKGSDYWEKGFQEIKEIGEYSYRTDAYSDRGYKYGSLPSFILFKDEKEFEVFSCPRKN